MEELILKAQKGDEDAFTSLVYEIRQDLYKIARCRLSCEDDIEDAIQETMIVAFKDIKKLKKLEAYKKWLIKILVNKCNYIYKKNKNRNVSFDNINPESACMENERYTELEEMDFYRVLSGLTYYERMAITLFYLEEYSLKEISKLLKTNENTVKTKLKRGRNKIKQRYIEGGF